MLQTIAHVQKIQKMAEAHAAAAGEEDFECHSQETISGSDSSGNARSISWVFLASVH